MKNNLETLSNELQRTEDSRPFQITKPLLDEHIRAGFGFRTKHENQKARLTIINETRGISKKCVRPKWKTLHDIILSLRI